MRTRVTASLGAGFLLSLTLAAPAAQGAEQGLPMVTVPESIVAKNVPPIPHDRVADLLPYENIRTAIFSEWHPKERRILIRTRFSQSPQLHELAMPMGYRKQLTFFNDSVAFG